MTHRRCAPPDAFLIWDTSCAEGSTLDDAHEPDRGGCPTWPAMENDMIDFRLTETDEAHLARTFAEGEIIRRYAREVDENEAEMPPMVLPEADEFYANAPALPEVGAFA